MTAYVHRRLLALCAVGALVLTGCSESLPQTEAAPQPSAQEESPTPDSEPIPKFDVPEYTTDLDLTAEEMLAAEEALIGLQRYIFVSEQVMKSGGEDTADLPSVASEDGLDTMEKTAQELADNNQIMIGELELSDYFVESVATEVVELTACLKNDSHGFKYEDSGKIERGPGDDTMWWTLQQVSGTWKVKSQELGWRGCTRPD
ncbi:hypothetical protein [uncultured Brevibacterium sp.]|uniref:hypothetical protein n=1 Tax=uncultured Brevibacterium sp. TaxID=189678 RepID=UPI0025F09B9B|nr:hypothetical protein [uncultured Brevibacterium sp.]